MALDSTFNPGFEIDVQAVVVEVVASRLFALPQPPLASSQEEFPVAIVAEC